MVFWWRSARSKSKVYEAVPPLTSTSSSTTPSSTARARAPHNSHNKSPRTTDARSIYKGITDQKEDQRVREGTVRRSGVAGERGERIRNNGSTQIAKPPLLRKALLLHLRREAVGSAESCRRIYEAKILRDPSLIARQLNLWISRGTFSLLSANFDIFIYPKERNNELTLFNIDFQLNWKIGLMLKSVIVSCLEQTWPCT